MASGGESDGHDDTENKVSDLSVDGDVVRVKTGKAVLLSLFFGARSLSPAIITDVAA